MLKVISYYYRHPKLKRPVVTIMSGFWPFRKRLSYICYSNGVFYTDWRCLETGQNVSGRLGNKLYDLLQETATKAYRENNLATI